MDFELKPVAPGDIARLVAIGPDREAYLAFGGDPRQSPTGGTAWATPIIERIERAFWGRIIEVEGALVGEVKLQSHSAQDASVRLAIGLFRADLRNQGLGRRVIARVLDHAFGPLALQRVELRVLAFNTKAIRCYEAAGFRHEGRLRASVGIGDDYVDDLIMSYLASDPRPSLP